MRLYFTEYASSARAGIRPLQFASVLGAVVIGAVLHALCGTPIANIAVWCGAIALGEAGIVVVNQRFLAGPPEDARLPAWASTKAAIATFGSFAYSLGAPLLHMPGESLTVIVPPWTIIMYCCGAVWAGAFYIPAMIGMILASTVPAAVWLLPHEGLDRATGLCLLIAVPYFLFIGRAAAARYRAAVNDKIEIGLLLRQQSAYTERIEQLSAERTRFFSAASHDLRQPLHAMGLYLALLKRRPADADELIENLSQCAFSLDSQFNAILGVDQTDELIDQAQAAPVSLDALFERIAVQARPRAAADGLRLRIAPTAAWAFAPVDILERVVNNLVSNALRYTREGGVLVGARRRGGQIVIQVSDTGVGIAPEHRDAIFRDFYQIDNPGRRRDRGFGLGLGIVRRLCQGMGWTVGLQSQPGRGTTFTIAVPMAEPPVGDDAPVAVAAAAPVAPAAPGARATRNTLVVDDDPQVLDAMRRLFERWEAPARLCATPDEALAILAAGDRAQSWNVLIDYRLAGPVNGLQVAGQILALYGERILPVIITGEVDEAVESGAKALGVLILTKPVQPMRLRALLTR